MRPLKLVVEGFKPFKGREIIDFSNLSFFVIRGPTGSGKSSILDAIRFALFGKTPDGIKAIDELINLSRETMFIDFTFSVGNKVYNVVRRKRKGSSTQVRLKINGVPKGSTTDAINREIVKAIGVNAEQFEKLFFIPQGRYAEFFNSGAKERRNLIISLLNLDFYEKLGGLIGEELNRVREELARLEGIFATLNEYTDEKLQELTEELEQTEKELKKLEEQKEKLEKKLEKLKKLKELTDQKEELEKKLKELSGKELENLRKEVEFLKGILPLSGDLQRYLSLKGEIERLGENIKSLEKEIKTKRDELKNLEKQKEVLESKLNDLRKKSEEIEKFKNYLANLENREPKLRELKQKKKQLDTEEKALNEQFLKLEGDKTDLKKLEKGIETLKSELESLQYSPDEEVKLKEQLLKAKELRKISAERDTLLREITRAEEELNKLKKLLEEKLEKLQKLSEEEKKLKRRERDYLVYLLVKDLKEGDPCPVCGNPYTGRRHFGETDFDPRLLEELEKRIETLKGEIEELKRKKAVKETELNHLKEKLEKLEERLEDFKGIPELEEVEKKLLELQSRKKRREELQKELEEKEELKRKLEEEIHREEVELTSRREGLKRQREVLNAEIEDIKEFLRSVARETRIIPPKGQNAFKYLKEELRKRVKAYETEEKSLTERLNETEKEMAFLRAEIKGKTENLSGLKENLENLLSELKNILNKLQSAGIGEGEVPELVEKLNKFRELETELNNRIGEIEKIRLRLEDINKELETFKGENPEELPEVERKLRELERERNDLLQKLGFLEKSIQQTKEKLKEKKKIKNQLEELRKKEAILKTLRDDFRSDRLIDFVVERAISDVVELAGENLFKLTERYRFTQRGTDIFILDLFEEKERNVRTLSGGETFLASISFALALGEYIGSNASVESLFIDEGFGTLDKERLEKIGNLFETLRLKLDKVVGVITHLEELSQFFDQQILVERTPNGSRIKVFE
jgi:exonuclease SbcC